MKLVIAATILCLLIGFSAQARTNLSIGIGVPMAPVIVEAPPRSLITSNPILIPTVTGMWA